MDHVDLSQVSDALRAPFGPDEERYRIGPCWTQGGTRFTRPLAFIDARAVFERLDAAVGAAGWTSDLERLAAGVYLCRLTVLGVTRADVGMAGENESEKEKSGASDAIKRAAVQFGIGRYLYTTDLPPVQLERRGDDWVLPRGWSPEGPHGHTARVQGIAAPANMAAGATDKQIGLLTSLMEQLGWDEDRGRQHVQATFNKRSRRELTRREASQFIEELNKLRIERAHSASS